MWGLPGSGKSEVLKALSNALGKHAFYFEVAYALHLFLPIIVDDRVWRTFMLDSSWMRSYS